MYQKREICVLESSRSQQTRLSCEGCTPRGAFFHHVMSRGASVAQVVRSTHARAPAQLYMHFPLSSHSSITARPDYSARAVYFSLLANLFLHLSCSNMLNSPADHNFRKMCTFFRKIKINILLSYTKGPYSDTFHVATMCVHPLPSNTI